MSPAVLIFGEEFFSSFLLSLVQGISNTQISTARTVQALEGAVRPDCPGLLILQDSPEVRRWIESFKQQPNHRWVYCLLISTQIAQTNAYESSDAAQLWAQALEAGADAYLGLGSQTDGTRLLQAHVQTGLAHMQKYLELTQVNDLLSAIALSDGLTRLNNRRALDWELPRQIQMARSQDLPLALIMLDIDYFKVVNDTHGHLVGDQVLRILAARLRHNLRSDETLYRYGGEEFAIILNNTSPEEALPIAQRLRSLVDQQPFVIDNSLEISITLSMGVASLNAEDDSQGLSLLGRSDQNLLEAKLAGRNRIVQS
ncbi:GGDEF domain-containing protein [filamentous cyanobacterium CCP5]|nr:GGDEF domain-containing protein [filamentous cyanobacterium CCP5]